MKKNNKYRFVVAALALSMVLTAGCGKKKSKDEAVESASSTDAIETEKEESIVVSPEKEMKNAGSINIYGKEGMVINELTGLWIEEKLSNQRPVAVMINNIDDAIPHSGISTADITYEMIAEGGITRLMCLFKDYENLPKLGSVRSARQYFVQVANMHNAIYAHIGYSPLGRREIENSGIDNLNGLSGAVSAITYYRDETRYAPHNCYTDGPRIVAGIEEDGYSREYTESHDAMYLFNKEDTKLNTGKKANTVTVGFRSAYKPYFEYHEEDGLYYRFEYGGPHMDEYTNTQLSFKNIIIICADYSTLDNGRNVIDWSLGGIGYYVSDGEYMDITWKKDKGVLKYYDDKGKQIRINPGQTFVEVFDDDHPQDIVFE